MFGHGQKGTQCNMTVIFVKDIQEPELFQQEEKMKQIILWLQWLRITCTSGKSVLKNADQGNILTGNIASYVRMEISQKVICFKSNIQDRYLLAIVLITFKKTYTCMLILTILPYLNFLGEKIHPCHISITL